MQVYQNRRSAAALARLAAAECPSFTRLQDLSIIHDEGISSRGATLLAAAPLFSRLASLELSVAGLKDGGVAALVQAPPPSELRRLDLSFNGIGPEGARALAEAPLCDALTRLDLSGNAIDTDGLKAVANSETSILLSELK